MIYGIIITALLLILVAYVILQETRAQLHWRDLVGKGNVDAIRELLQNEVERWHTERVPKNVPALLWHGIQTVELIDIAADAARVNCSAEGEFSLVNGRRVETSSPLDEGKKITMKLADLIMYEVPNVKLDRVQIDVYTSYRDERGQSDPQCILSTMVQRKDIEDLDWEGTTATEFVEMTKGRYSTDNSGAVRPIEPMSWPGGASAKG